MREMSVTTGLKAAAALSLAAGAMFAGTSGAAATVLPDRESDPVVLTGADAPNLIGSVPSSIVAFRYNGRWAQVPVQVDERDRKSVV